MRERLERLLGGRRGRGVSALRRLVFRQRKLVLGGLAVNGIIEVHARRVAKHHLAVHEEAHLAARQETKNVRHDPFNQSHLTLKNSSSLNAVLSELALHCANRVGQSLARTNCKLKVAPSA